MMVFGKYNFLHIEKMFEKPILGSTWSKFWLGMVGDTLPTRLPKKETGKEM